MKALAAGSVTAATIALFGAAPADADNPMVFTEQGNFVDINPCTGIEHEITLTTTFHVHEHGGRMVVHRDHTLSTSSGFSGRGTGTYVNNGNVELFRVNDTLTNPDGDRIRAHFVFLADLKSEEVRVDKFTLTCL